MSLPYVNILFAVLPAFMMSQPKDSLTVYPVRENLVEIRVTNGNTAFEFEVNHSFNRFFSGDVVLSIANAGIRGGFSLYPVSFLFVQGTIGTTDYKDIVLDGPQFNPDFVYTVRGGVRVPLAKLPLAFSFGFGKMFMYQYNYNPNSGFVFPGYERKPSRTEIRNASLTSVGVSLRF